MQIHLPVTTCPSYTYETYGGGGVKAAEIYAAENHRVQIDANTLFVVSNTNRMD